MKAEKQIAADAAKFAERWKGKGSERSDSQPFWLDLLSNVFGIETPSNGFITFEEHHMVDASNFIDGHIPSTKVLIEQKSLGVNLRLGIRQSDGAVLTPFLQARRYVVSLPVSQHPRWIVTCNFSEFLVYDMDKPNAEPESILLENLGKEFYRMQFLVDSKNEHISKEERVSLEAGKIVGKMYDALVKQYGDDSPQASRWLNILCVRLVFCLYAEDAGLFTHNQFHDFLARYEAEDLRRALRDLFEVLNKPQEKRSKYLKDDLKAFPYTNGGLFEEEIEIPQFTEELKQILLQDASLDFDWSDISPTIFGGVFESTLNPETRRSGGMHYTSIENIHKVIDPLFLNDLRSELDTILEEKVERQRNKKLEAYQNKLASLTFLDPACGSGNFLTETYLSLRRLENEAIREMTHGQTQLAWEGLSPVKVSIHQFYGIEINDFAVEVARTALWISEAQMLAETERIIHHEVDFLPLKSYANIVEGNALRMDWSEWEVSEKTPTVIAKNTYVIFEDESLRASEPTIEYKDINLVTSDIQRGPKPAPKRKVIFDYIMGNPPFVGHNLRSNAQKADMEFVFGKVKMDKSDYVASWFYKAARCMQGTCTHSAFVATNSLCQGISIGTLWKTIFNMGCKIDFAWQTFVWNSEASDKAHVHVIIVGFSDGKLERNPRLYSDGGITICTNINGYLIDAPIVCPERRSTPISEVPPIRVGSLPRSSAFTVTVEERPLFIADNPICEKWIKPYIGSEEFINGGERYCLWLKGANIKELRACRKVMERVEEVRKARLASPAATTRRAADTPTLFAVDAQPDSNYLVIPQVSSEKRRYIPIGFMSPDIIASNLVFVVPDATLYHFGILTSNVHNAWMRVVAGRLESRYRYGGDLVYNNFPWPNPTEEQKQKIEQTAQGILDTRALYPDSSLADLYDELTMPPELRKAHQENDRAVMQAYGWKASSQFTESMCVAELFKMYQELAKKGAR
ncbi:MAG: class I SAM-dependent DNA methyltransferase [Desulfovibrionaceae bacterium]|nr:class I SAM-dependent DNA methyltransferase [Desulfovibrionaceae bacterium]